MKTATIPFISKSPAVVSFVASSLKRSPYRDDWMVEVNRDGAKALEAVGAAASTEAKCDCDSGYFKDGLPSKCTRGGEGIPHKKSMPAGLRSGVLLCCRPINVGLR
jgi:hypothetical protein